MNNTSKCRKRFKSLLKHYNGGGFFFSSHFHLTDHEHDDNVDKAYRIVREMKEYQAMEWDEQAAFSVYVFGHKRSGK